MNVMWYDWRLRWNLIRVPRHQLPYLSLALARLGPTVTSTRSTENRAHQSFTTIILTSYLLLRFVKKMYVCVLSLVPMSSLTLRKRTIMGQGADEALAMHKTMKWCVQYIKPLVRIPAVCQSDIQRQKWYLPSAWWPPQHPGMIAGLKTWLDSCFNKLAWWLPQSCGISQAGYKKRSCALSGTIIPTATTIIMLLTTAIDILCLRRTWLLAIPLICLYFIFVALYRLYFSPLANFPGPKLAALTSWVEFYHDVIRRGQYTFEIVKMHEKYGTPNQMTF